MGTLYTNVYSQFPLNGTSHIILINWLIFFCNQPFFALYFSVWEISRGFYSWSTLCLEWVHIKLIFTLFRVGAHSSLYLSFTFLSLSLLLSLFSLSLSLAYLMDVFVLVYLWQGSLFGPSIWNLHISYNIGCYTIKYFDQVLTHCSNLCRFTVHYNAKYNIKIFCLIFLCWTSCF